MMIHKFIFIIFILLASCLNNLIIPYVIYFKKYGFFKKRKKGFIGVNMWGIIMDGILAGLINIITLDYLLEIKQRMYMQDILFSLVSGFLFMVCCHIYMSVNKWKIWIMPKPWKWNEAGYWHMVSMTLQMSYIAYCLLILFKNPILLTQTSTQLMLGSTLLLGLLFVLAIRQHIKGLTIGRVYIGNEAW